ncbi:MAG: GDYXXLXY domain-containing protein, partial [Bacteroidota bacterium]
LIFTLFALMVLAQLYVPAKMIYDQEDILNSGNSFKFKTQPIDPEDPFRGRYVALNFEEISQKQDTGLFEVGDNVFASFETGKDGFAMIKSISKTAPENESDYLKTYVSYIISSRNGESIAIDIPFDRFYMEEFKATEAEKTYWNSLRDTSKMTYAIVFLKNGNYALQNVMIDGVSLQELVEDAR